MIANKKNLLYKRGKEWSITMQNSLSINPMTRQEMGKYSRISFEHKTPEERRTRYQKSLEKRAYIENETEPLNNLGFGLLVMSLLLDTQHINLKNLKGKLSTADKIGVGTFVLAFASFIAACVKGIKLSKQYDLDNKS